MIRDGKIWVGMTENKEPVCITLKMANRHGLIAGATGTGKTVTLKVLAETFSDMGVPVFMADVKGDIAGMLNPGSDSEDMQKRIAYFGLNDYGFQYQGYPVTLWDIYGQNGIPVRATVSEVGPLLMSRILDLNDLQTDLLNIVFKIADDNNLLLIDTKDLKAMLNYVNEHAREYQASYGHIASNSIGAIIRAVVALEADGGDVFFGEPSLCLQDWMCTAPDGRGMIQVLDSRSLIQNGRLYSTFLLWFLSELFESLPEVGDLDKPKMVFFFDEAHLLFNDISKTLLDKIEQVVKLVRSKGVGVYFCTQDPRDIPDSVMAQLNNKIEHGLRAYTPADQKSVKAAAESFRVNPDMDTYTTILNLGTGEAVVSFLGEDGIPGMAQKVKILPPRTSFSAISDDQRAQAIKSSTLYSKYASGSDRDSAYEELTREAEKAEQEKADQEKAEQDAKTQAAQAKAEEKEKEQAAKAGKRAAKSVGSTVAGTIGREVGKSVGGKFGSFGKTLGGNLGAALGRGILSTLFRG